MSARRTWSGTTENGSEITFTGCVDLKVWKKQKFEIQYSPAVCKRTEYSVLRHCQSEEQTNLTDFARETFSPECEITADVFPGIKRYSAHRYVFKVTAAEFQDTPADPQTLEMGWIRVYHHHIICMMKD